MTRWLTDPEQLAWRHFLAGASRLMEHCDQSLQENHGIPMTDYEILVFLSEAEGHRIRMSEIADHVLVSRSRLTYRVDRLVEAGYVRRSKVEDDKRGLYAELTEAGMTLLEAAARTHVGDVQSRLMEHIPPDELGQFGSLWSTVLENLATEAE